MKETCGICGQWKGLHEANTLHCPVDGSESGLFIETIYRDSEGMESTIAAQAARIAALEDVINLGLFAMFIPAIRDIRQRQLESGQSPIADFEEAARDLLANKEG